MTESAPGSRRLAPRTPRRLWLPCTVSVGAIAAVAFGAVTRVVAGHEGPAVYHPYVTAWMVGHRTEWLTSNLSVATWLGSTAVIVPRGASSEASSSCGDAGRQPLALLAAAGLRRPAPACAGRQD
jgi:hypothetical protein